MSPDNKTLFFTSSLILLYLLSTVAQQTDLTTDLGDKRYLIITTLKLNWFEANYVCTSKNMALASIESETEYENLRNYLIQQNHISDEFWLSGNSLSGDTTFTWLSSGNALSFTKWAQTPAAEKCIKTNAAFSWENGNCETDKIRAICSRPLIPDCGLTGGCQIDSNFFF